MQHVRRFLDAHQSARARWPEPTPDGARGAAYLLNIIPSDAGKPAAITAIAFYEDKFVKTQDGWKIKQRRAHSKGGLTPSIIVGTATNQTASVYFSANFLTILPKVKPVHRLPLRSTVTSS